ncbi:hypothetical protein [Hymenobacter sp. B81]|uniref:hypothetical protein n=1 Tax=Hymenobacter sp. B81 TaxID=3344878 RepID=UPI0037DC7943
MLHLILLGWLFTPADPPAGSPPHTLRLEARNMDRNVAYHVVVSRGTRHTTVRYARQDSVKRHFDPTEERLLTEAQTLIRNTPKDTAARAVHNQQLANLMDQYKAVRARHTVYTQDSIVLRNSHPTSRTYLALLDSVYRAGNEHFADPGHIRRQNEQRTMVLHGTTFSLQLASPGQRPRRFSMYAPDAGTNPLFTRFLQQTLELYRRDHPNSFMSREFTRGY